MFVYVWVPRVFFNFSRWRFHNGFRRNAERYHYYILTVMVRTRIIGSNEIRFFQPFLRDKFRLYPIGAGECRVQVLFAVGSEAQ